MARLKPASEDRRPNAIVADDDAAMRLLVSSALQEEGFSVTEAVGGQEAIDAFRQSRPDLILMDVEMPGTNGYEADLD